ncbi:hypothetical protein SDC9_176801 [bioreactor metagenome]|uniref:Uncharacterized protein n=1 Tax=bioreactor metagenome TaxID=1076179 RepID=A0A645GR26_9ZZZZ
MIRALERPRAQHKLEGGAENGDRAAEEVQRVVRKQRGGGCFCRIVAAGRIDRGVVIHSSCCVVIFKGNDDVRNVGV